MPAASQAPTLHRFAHEAMATTFEIILAAKTSSKETALYAAQAAQALFAEIDRIEDDLSHFISSSDISRINHLGAKEPVRVSLYTFECLQLAERLYRQTGGVFDVTIGALMACWRTPDGKSKRPSVTEINAARALVGMDKVVFNKQDLTIALKKDGVSLDLGGIGKGYALDKAAELLEDWREDTPDITGALLHGGESSVLAIDAPPAQSGWKVSVGADMNDPNLPPEEILLRDRALSGSGTQLRGEHIIDPRTARPARGALRAWASSPSGTASDALATAFMTLSPDEVKQYCARHPNTWAILLVCGAQGPKFQHFGKR